MAEQLTKEEDFSQLLELANRLKLRELFEEPSSYEDEPEEGG
jgi:hypothetical protein